MCELHSYQISVSAIVLWMERLKIKILAWGKAKLESLFCYQRDCGPYPLKHHYPHLLTINNQMRVAVTHWRVMQVKWNHACRSWAKCTMSGLWWNSRRAAPDNMWRYQEAGLSFSQWMIPRCSMTAVADFSMLQVLGGFQLRVQKADGAIACICGTRDPWSHIYLIQILLIWCGCPLSSYQVPASIYCWIVPVPLCGGRAVLKAVRTSGSEGLKFKPPFIHFLTLKLGIVKSLCLISFIRLIKWFRS